MTEPVLPEGVLTLDRNAQVPLPEQIYRSIRSAIWAGALKAGAKLPSTRSLAVSLGVSRNTVNTAYELLKSEGTILLRPGAAPLVSKGLSLEGAEGHASEAANVPKLSKRGSLLSDNLRGAGWSNQSGALQPGSPALDCFPFEEWARCLRRAARQLRGTDLHYQNYTGLEELKTQIARHLSAERGVSANPNQILITSSMQACLYLLSQSLADPGEDAWLEEPGYLGARTAFHGAGLNIHPIPTDEHGADASKMATGLSSPKLIYVTPSHHYPLGARMSLQRRRALLKVAEETGAVVLEDDYDSEFLFSGRPIAALHGLAEKGRVIYLGTFAKSLLPGLRLAYCVVPTNLTEDLTQLMRNTGCAANVQAQAALAMFMDCGAYSKHLKKIREIYEKRGNYLVTVLRQRLANQVEVSMPTGNVQLAVTFREPLDDVSIALKMQSNGFGVSALSNCYLNEPQRRGLIIGFAGESEEQINQGVEVLASLLRDQRMMP